MLVIQLIEHKNRGVIMRKAEAFSLIELLVVMGIIALLMGISLPAIHKVKEQAKSAVCSSNMREIGFAANVYSEDRDLFIPRGTQNAGEGHWFELFMPYMAQRPVNNDYRNVKVYRCPSYPDREQTVCYVVNAWAFSSEDDTVGYETTKPTKLTECRGRAYSVYLADNEYGAWRPIIRRATDAGIQRCDVWYREHLPDSVVEDVTFGRRVARDRHRKGSNYLYLDWHVDWVATKDMTVDVWRLNLTR